MHKWMITILFLGIVAASFFHNRYLWNNAEAEPLPKNLIYEISTIQVYEFKFKNRDCLLAYAIGNKRPAITCL